MPPRNARSGPEPNPSRFPEITAAASAKKDDRPSPATVQRKRPAGQRPQNAATCRVSLLTPSGRRTRWWSVARCPVCGTPHLRRSVTLEGVTGTRRLPCGHWVSIVIARTYGRTEPGVAA